MRITNAEKLSMCKEHVINGRSLSHISERFDNYDLGLIDPSILRDWIKKYDSEGEDGVHRPFPTYFSNKDKKERFLLHRA